MKHSRLFTSPKLPTPLSQTGYVRLPAVLAYIGISKSTFYDGIKTGLYPKQIKIGKRAVGWDVDDIRRCMAARKIAS